MPDESGVSPSQFTEAEEAFINANTEVFRATLAVNEATQAQLTAMEFADSLSGGLNLNGDVQRMFQLVREGGYRAGFDDDHPLQQMVSQIYDAVSGLVADTVGVATGPVI